MKVLVGCEFSGRVRDAFAARGHDAWSVDLEPTEQPGQHAIGDAIAWMLGRDWDLMIAFPPCTYLCNSGVRWLREERGRRAKMRAAARFFRTLLTASGIPRVAVENPIPHKYAVKEIGRKYDQIIQPWQFGHGETKATCLWLKGLPKLKPTNIVERREAKVWKMAPGKNRSRDRSRTYTGIATAMAEQWGGAPVIQCEE